MMPSDAVGSLANGMTFSKGDGLNPPEVGHDYGLPTDTGFDRIHVLRIERRSSPVTSRWWPSKTSYVAVVSRDTPGESSTPFELQQEVVLRISPGGLKPWTWCQQAQELLRELQVDRSASTQRVGTCWPLTQDQVDRLRELVLESHRPGGDVPRSTRLLLSGHKLFRTRSRLYQADLEYLLDSRAG